MNASRVAVVTGGGSGMGEETCYELARRGHKVAVLDINEQEAKRVADAIGDHNAAAIGLGLGVDVTDRPAVESAL